MAVNIPTLNTGRLILRGPELPDLQPLIAFFQTDESRFVGGPMHPNDTQRAMLSTIGSWALYRFGLWHIADAVTNRFIGWTGLLLTAGKDEPGFAWTVLPEHQGVGIATEAATAALNHVRDHMGHDAPATFIDTDNAASQRIAGKLGFVRETTNGSEMTFRYAGGVA